MNLPLSITKNIHDWLFELMSAPIAAVVEMVLIAVAFLGFFALAGLLLVYMERRIAAFFQLRLGPNRVGPQGLFQTIADALKLVSKELVVIDKADKFLYNLAPYFVIVASLMALSVLPFSQEFHAFDINIGVFFLLAVSSIGVIGILLGGWASNNKYALIGAMRSGLQTISYELSVGLSILTIVLLAGSLQISEIIAVQQKGGWFIIQGHIPAFIAFMIFMIAGTAETNRAPFDLVEAESELGAGFHTEYSGMKFAYFFLAEFINMFIIAAIGTILFFGGWLSPFGITESIPLLGVMWFMLKVLGLVFLMMWFRWTFPRLRVDQLLTLEWKYLLPINLFNIVFMAVIVWLGLTINF
ncbi:MAG: NADH-quinone oxidoreductase subunit NuoH [Flavobacteriaceae bacterium]|nr:NADH-quinone oxidoreductase subunit NuoH [Flavobacteriaceae bacterium]